MRVCVDMYDSRSLHPTGRKEKNEHTTRRPTRTHLGQMAGVGRKREHTAAYTIGGITHYTRLEERERHPNSARLFVVPFCLVYKGVIFQK